MSRKLIFVIIILLFLSIPTGFRDRFGFWFTNGDGSLVDGCIIDGMEIIFRRRSYVA